jgi:type IV pilus assembly protein PilZ
MRLTVTATEGHQGKVLEVDCDGETITLLSSQGELMGTVTWRSLIAFIKTATDDDCYVNARDFPRAPLAVKVRCTTPEGKQFDSLTGGLGGGGLFIENSAPLPPGTELDVEFSLPDRPSERLTAKAKVAWVRNKPERYLLFPGMGVQFTEIASQDRDRLDELVMALNRNRQGA